jgi:hypothetical protein
LPDLRISWNWPVSRTSSTTKCSLLYRHFFSF